MLAIYLHLEKRVISINNGFKSRVRLIMRLHNVQIDKDMISGSQPIFAS